MMSMEMKINDEPSESGEDDAYLSPPTNMRVLNLQHMMCDVEVRNGSIVELQERPVPNRTSRWKDMNGCSENENEIMEYFQRNPKPRRDKVKRGSNFTHDERLLLIRLAVARRNIVENKRTDNINITKKSRAWYEIEKAFNSSKMGPLRDAKSLKIKYEAIKREIRKTDQEMKTSSGGPPEETEQHLTKEEIILRDIMGIDVSGLNPALSDSEGESFCELSPSQDRQNAAVVTKCFDMGCTDVKSWLRRTNGNSALEYTDRNLESQPLNNCDPSPAAVAVPTTESQAYAVTAENTRLTSSTPDQRTALTAGSSVTRRPMLKRKMSSAADFERIAKMRKEILKKKNRIFKIHLATAAIQKETAALEKERTSVLLEIAKKQLLSIQ